MKILISSDSCYFDVTTPETEPLGGTESSIAYLATELAKTHEVTILTNTNDATIRSVVHRSTKETSLEELVSTQHFDIVILVNDPVNGPRIRQATLNSKIGIIIWSHVIRIPDVEQEYLTYLDIQRSIDRVVYVSEYQRSAVETLFKIRGVKYEIIGNGFAPCFENIFSDIEDLANIKSWRAAYTSVPDRGLRTLVKVYQDEEFLNTNPPIADIYSSYRIHQAADSKFPEILPLYDEVRANPNMEYHGALSQPELALAMRNVSFFTYPCIFKETYCISALEAMAAGALVISVDLGALKSTSMEFGILMPLPFPDLTNDILYNPRCGLPYDNVVIQYRHFYMNIFKDFKANREKYIERMWTQVQAVNNNCTWKHRAASWDKLFNEIVKERQTI